MKSGRELKRLRTLQGLTQDQIAEKTGITVRQYRNYETGQQVPGAVTANRMAKILHTTSEQLFGI